MVKKIMSMLLAVVLLFSIAPLHLYDTAWAAASQRSASTSRSYPTLAANSTWYKGTTAKSAITEITLMNSGKPSGTVVESWDASVAQDGSIKAYIVGTKLTLVGDGSGKIAANVDSRYAFFGFGTVTAFTGLDKLDTSNVTNMAWMFGGCSALTGLDVSNFNTAQVTRMNSMFNSCKALTSLDVSNFNTAKVTDMSRMFYLCEALTSLDLSNFNTAKVTSMDSMFNSCKALTSLDVSNFNTAQVTRMNSMFCLCEALTSLDVTKFDTSLVTSMDSMFLGCKKLTDLDVTKFDTSKVTDMGSMFSSCAALTGLNVSNFNTANVTDMSWMFNFCKALTGLDVTKFDTSKVTSMYNMFNSCKALTSLDVSNFNTAKVTDMSGMFSFCAALTSLDLSNFDTANVTDMDSMFTACYKLQTLTLGAKFQLYNGYTGLPAPSSTYISGATGRWYNTTTGTGYTPAQLAKVTRTETRTYSAVRNIILDAPVVTLGHSASSGKPQLTWNAVTGATAYEVYRSTSQSGTYSLLGTTAATSYTNTGAVAGTTYYYKVKAICGNGASAYSNIVSGQVKALLPATVPVVTVGHSSSSGKPQLTWKPVTGATSYKVYRAVSKAGTYELINTVKVTSYTNTYAAPGVTYYYKVEALNGANKVLGVSAIVEGKVAPVLAVGYSTVSGKPQLAWKAIPGATEYRVYRSEKRDSGYTLINKTTAATYVNTGARANVTYFYKVAAVKGTAVSDYSNIVTAAPRK